MPKSLYQEVHSCRRLFALVVAAGLAGGAAAVFQARYLAQIVDAAFLANAGLAQLAPQFWLLLAAACFRAVTLYAGERFGFRLAASIKADLRLRLLGHLFALGPTYAGREQAGELLNTLTEGIENLESYFAKYLPQLVTVALVPPVMLAVAFSLDLAAALIMLVTAPLIPLFMLLIGRWAGAVQRRQWAVLSRLSGHLMDVLQGLATLKIFNRSAQQAIVISRLSNEFRDATLSVLKVAFLSALALELLTTLSTALVAVSVGLELLYGRLSFYQAFFVLLLAPEYYLPFRLLGSHFHSGLAGSTAAERIYAHLTVPLPSAASAPAYTPFKSQGRVAVEFEAVSFSYPGAARPALQAVSFTVGPGQELALVGPSGAGKSTVADLLLKFIQPGGGTVRINGRPLDSISREDWLAQVAYVPQFPRLFYGSVAENIRFGADGDEIRTIEAARLAGAHEFIERLPRGYDTVIGEGGQGLSGGEGQRIAIARAFFRNPAVLIVDEAATALDPKSEAVVREALSRLKVGRTVLLIAHRLSSVYAADRTVVLDRGQVVEAGNHAELYAAQGMYYRLVAAYRGPV